MLNKPKKKIAQLQESSFSSNEGSLLKDDAGTISDKMEVGEAVHDHGTFALLDHIREYRVRRLGTRVAVGENFSFGALDPVDVGRCVDRRLDVRPVEVQGSGLGLEKRSPGPQLQTE